MRRPTLLCYSLTVILGCACSEDPKSSNDGSGLSDGAVDKDGRSPDQGDPGDLAGDTLEDDTLRPPPAPPLPIQPDARCASATSLRLVNGRVSVVGSLTDLGTPADPQLSCESSPKHLGYYRISLQAEKHYRFTLATHDSAQGLWVFGPDVGCDAQKAELACKSHPAFDQGLGHPGILELVPTRSGDHVVSVHTGSAGGVFRLTVEELGSPPVNDRCEEALSIAMSNGRATVRGNPTVADVPFAEPLYCWGDPVGPGDRSLFYRLQLTKGLAYSFHLRPTRCKQQLYLVDAPCDAAKIAAQCRDNHISSYLDFRADKDGEHLFAVTGSCPFTLDISEDSPPSNGRCQDAERLSFSGNTATARGSTVGATNEFKVDCGGMTFTVPDTVPAYAEGPQVYYRIALVGGQHYRIATRSNHRVTPYIFSAQANCEAAQIEADCNSGTRGARLTTSAFVLSREITFEPKDSGEYIIAIDSSHADANLSKPPPPGGFPLGDFELVVQRLDSPTNHRCQTPRPIILQGGKATIEDNTSGAPSQLAPRCGALPMFWPSPGRGPLHGPERYFTLEGKAGTAYQLQLQASFPATLYAVSQGETTCDEAKISTACDCIKGNSLDPLFCTAARAGATYHMGDKDQQVLIAVDSAGDAARGYFRLDITARKYEADRCEKPKIVSLQQNPTTISGDTAFARDEFSSWEFDAGYNFLHGVRCGGRSIFSGGQLYYRITLERGKRYSIGLEPEFDGALYAFPATTDCSRDAVDAACTSPEPLDGRKLLNSDLSGAYQRTYAELAPVGGCGCGGSPGVLSYGVGGENVEFVSSEEWVHITPERTEDWIVAVDSKAPQQAGAFRLHIHWN